MISKLSKNILEIMPEDMSFKSILDARASPDAEAPGNLDLKNKKGLR